MARRRIVCVLTLLGCAYLSQGSRAQPKLPPPGVIAALGADEKLYCEQFEGAPRKRCSQDFRANLLWREAIITPSGKVAILVEVKNIGFCGTAGCSLYLFDQQADGEFAQVLGTHGETGALERTEILKTVTKGHYDFKKTWADGRTHSLYRWDGARYSDKAASKETLIDH